MDLSNEKHRCERFQRSVPAFRDNDGSLFVSNSLSDPSAKLENGSTFGRLIILGKLMRGRANALMPANSARQISMSRYNDQQVARSLTLITRLLFAVAVMTGFMVILMCR